MTAEIEALKLICMGGPREIQISSWYNIAVVGLCYWRSVRTSTNLKVTRSAPCKSHVFLVFLRYTTFNLLHIKCTLTMTDTQNHAQPSYRRLTVVFSTLTPLSPKVDHPASTIGLLPKLHFYLPILQMYLHASVSHPSPVPQ